MNEWFWLVAAIVGCFGLGALMGAPFLPIRNPDVEAALDLAELKAGQTLIDLGSGDGRILLAAARRGANAIGYEINPLLYLWSLVLTWPYRRHINIHLKDYWHTKLPPADVIYLFLLDRYTARLDTKLKAELIHPTNVVSYVFEMPRKPRAQTYNTWLYRYP
ncbi:MAG TPA: hypothetical protein VMR98_00295 [Candidatus Polarisedimenticolaceae bacterium]|nr:hypothetical protein [Candidatus Polarisedimenticolaceae bacterium]